MVYYWGPGLDYRPELGKFAGKSQGSLIKKELKITNNSTANDQSINWKKKL